MDVCAKAVPRSFLIFSQLEEEEDDSVLLKGLEEDSFTVKSYKMMTTNMWVRLCSKDSISSDLRT